MLTFVQTLLMECVYGMRDMTTVLMGEYTVQSILHVSWPVCYDIL